MTKDQLRQMKNSIQSQYDLKQYYWDNALAHADTNTNEDMFKANQTMYYEASAKLDGMLHMYAIISNTDKFDVEFELNQLKSEWSKQS